ncbi:MAG: flavodoxin family protein [Oscillospiraceae bacterium]|nr:flavodoxin family protein [Oscillospiraceae bacterium]
MKVLLVNGSPHENGCTDAALSFVASALREEEIETEKFWIGTGATGGCIACGGCRTTGACIRSERVQTFAELADEADGFVFGSPVHYAGISGSMDAFMDCLFFSSPPTRFRLKPAACVLSARRAGTTAAYDQMIKYFGISEMPIVSSTYWNMVHGTKAEDVLEDAEGVACMRTLGRNMAYLLRAIEAGKKAGVIPPEPQPVPKTNFIR